MAAARLHVQLGTQEALTRGGGSVDVFQTIFGLRLPLLLRPLTGLLGAYIPAPTAGVLVTTERPLNIQRFTAAHELGHFRLGHQPSLDDESILRRMAANDERVPGPELQEVEADAFAVSFLMPRWLIHWHCHHQGWFAEALTDPRIAYQLALRLGTSYEATTWTLQRSNLISAGAGETLRGTPPRKLKADLLADYRPPDYRGDVWLLTERDEGCRIDGSRNDLFVLRLNEHSGGGYLWNIDQLRESGFAIIRDTTESADVEGIGGPLLRRVTAGVEAPQRGRVALAESRPWQSNAPITELTLDYDLTGPEEKGFSRAERRQLFEAA
jgi:hypothetical protein